MSPTDIAAWWGAVIATLVFFWDVVKWRWTGRPRIKLKIRTNMVTMQRQANQQTYVIIEAINNGDRTTTVQLVSLEFFERKPPFFRKRNVKSIVANPAITQPLPHALEPGKPWSGQILQNADLEQMARNGYLYCQVHCSHSNKPSEIRITLSRAQ